MANTTENVAQKAGKCFLPKVANAIFYYNNEIAFTATANTDSQVNIQTTTEYKRAGQNNVVIGTIISEKTVEANFTTPEWKIEFLAANVGTTILVGSIHFTITDLQLTVTNGTITLPAVPVDKVIYVEINGGYVKIPATSTSVSLTSYGITGDDCVYAIGCFNKTGKHLNISTSSSPLVGKLILETPIFKGTVGEIGKSQYVFPAFALSGNWDQSFGADATYQISGTAISTTSDVCGEGGSYGSYQEYFYDDSELNAFKAISISPAVVELTPTETQALTVYGSKGGMYAKSLISSGVTFASADSDVATVGSSTGIVTAVASGTTTVTATYNGLTATVNVEVTSE